MTSRRHERGMALVVVLWTIAALSLIAAAMLASAMNAARIDRNAWNQLQVQTSADAGIQRAILSLFDPDQNKYPPRDGSKWQVQLDNEVVTLSVQQETGRIDLNYANRNLLRDLFKAAGASASEADTLADRATDWRSVANTRSLNGASAGDYRNDDSAYRPRGAAFQSVDELKLVMGMTPALFRRVEPALTVYSHRPDFDMRIAPKEVLEVVPGMDEEKAENIVASRTMTSGLPDATPIGSAYAAPLTSAGLAFSIIAEARQGQTRFTRRAAILISGDPGRPYWVLDWK